MAAAREQSDRAREKWTAAKSLIDEATLVAPRLRRLDRELDTKAKAVSAEIARLRQEISSYFDQALTLDTGTLALQARDFDAPLGRLPNLEARQKLKLALSIAQRAAQIASTKRGAPYDSARWLTPPTGPGTAKRVVIAAPTREKREWT